MHKSLTSRGVNPITRAHVNTNSRAKPERYSNTKQVHIRGKNPGLTGVQTGDPGPSATGGPVGPSQVS